MRIMLTTILASILVAGCTTQKAPEMTNYARLQALSTDAPTAPKQEFTASYHGRTLSDPYHWLKDQGYPVVDDKPVLDYLVAENDYYKSAFLTPNEPLINTLFEEFKGRTNEEESSVPWVDNDYEYRWYYREGEEYRTRSRKPIDSDKEEVFLDETELAKQYDYFVLGDWAISPDNRLLAYTFNTDGAERYLIKIKDLMTGEYLVDEISATQGSVAFSADSQHILYGKLAEDRWKTVSINVHKLGTEQADDKVILTEEDDSFFMGFGSTSDNAYFVLGSSRSETNETYVLPTNDPYAEPQLIVSREQEFSHSLDHANGNFYILANDLHKNFRLVKVANTDPSYDKWETLIEASDDLYLLGLQTFEDFIALEAREKGYEKIRIRDYSGASHDIEFPETIYSAGLGINSQFDQSFLRLNYESMITPDTVYDYDITSQSLKTRKTDVIPSGYDKSLYETKRLMAPARDGVSVPVSIVYKKGFKKDATQPLMLYGYGAYGVTVSPRFSTLRLSLLDRGFAFAIAHVRGSDMMGYQWYLDGKLEKRINAFNDFVDVARHLVDENYVAAGNISVSGRSAGGKLMGAVTIQAPELWRSVTLGVPFVDVLNTMLDASLPLTPPEWNEWGNPIESAEVYDRLLGYSPYDNIVAREYPPMLVTGGINDPRVTYWEPAKWTAKMRELKTDNNLMLMRINMGAGHFANSGRYGRLKDFAEEFAFVLQAHEISK